MLADFLLALPARLRMLQATEAGAAEEIVRGMISASLASAHATLRERQVVLRERVEQIIAAHLTSPRLTPGRIASLAGISRSSLYRLYEGHGGIADHVQRKRLDLVRRDLQNPLLANLPIATLAERRALHNASSFNRAFRRRYGCTPGEAREAWHPELGGGEQAQAHDVVRFIDLLR